MTRANVFRTIIIAILSLSLATNALAMTATVGNLTDLKTAVYNQMEAKDPSLTVTYSGKSKDITKTNVATSITNAMKVEDYVRYTLKGAGYSFSIPKTGNSTIYYSMVYWETAEQVQYVKDKAQEIINQIITSDMNDHQKVKALHDWVVLNFGYDTSLVSHSAYDGLTKGKTVCQGYALMMYRLLKTANIEARIVEGKANNGLHGWNLVKIDGNWYHLDPTWNDPLPDTPGSVKYGYYLLSDAEIKRDHAPIAGYPIASKNYGAELLKLVTSDPSREKFYQELILLLEYQYLRPENTIKDATALRKKVLDTISAGGTNFTVRYLKKSTLKVDMNNAFKGTGRGATYSFSDYFKTVDTNDVILSVSIK